ncbi:hypothetical protein OESDEN_09939 [Oesophagostomum dentatum]|uniref:Uncharacterized protein n=1 Tax=Oesophagostomum dentatum TaxID=61180 RepID=A0A0B1T363_OESDE|nr:hypothetical protein OESDEN_09939 [Oesophagostomum dentatum]
MVPSSLVYQYLSRKKSMKNSRNESEQCYSAMSMSAVVSEKRNGIDVHVRHVIANVPVVTNGNMMRSDHVPLDVAIIYVIITARNIERSVQRRRNVPEKKPKRNLQKNKRTREELRVMKLQKRLKGRSVRTLHLKSRKRALLMLCCKINSEQTVTGLEICILQFLKFFSQ